MAFQGVYAEHFYGSSVTITAVGGKLVGTYAPPAVLPAGEDPRTFVGLGQDRGEAVLAGTATPLAAAGAFALAGEWKHVRGPFAGQSGRFELVGGKAAASFAGWWSLDSEPQEQHEWRWTAAAAPATSAAPAALAAAAAHSVHMERFGMVCAWLFLLQTGAQLGTAAALLAGGDADADARRLSTDLNLCFNIDYALLYASFLAAYAVMHTRPPVCYVCGVALYCAGYACFAALYAQPAAASAAAAALYHAGSWLFLAGSLLLMHATAPPPATYAAAAHAPRPRPRRAALWWGAACFAAGSCVFVLDAAGFGDARRNAVAGLALFVLGRAFFVHGSQTPRCGLWLQPQQQQQQQQPAKPPPREKSLVAATAASSSQ